MPEDEIIRTRPTMHGYLASRLSDHISEMADGSLLVVDCPIARTGFQEYAIRDLPQEAAKDLGVDVSNPSALIDLYRPASEVFSPRFLASLNGRPITDGHPPDFVDTTNFGEYAMGHIQNPRKGPEPLDDGEWPILADLVISREPLVSKVKNKQARDISLGYDFSIDKDGDRIIQCDMMGNHTAVVPKGRAGDLIAIGDAAPPGNQIHSRAAPPEPEALTTKPPGSGDGPSVLTVNAVSTKKREKPNVKNNILHMLGLGLRARAADADTDPEELAQAALDMHDAVAKDKRGKDDGLDPDIEMTAQVADRKRKAKDLDPDDLGEMPYAEDRRGVHDALDKIMNAMDGKRGKDRHAGDADIAALRDLLDDYLGEEQQEPEHVADDLDGEEADPAELEAMVAADEPDPEAASPDGEEDIIANDDADEEMECSHCQTAMDGAEACPACGCTDAKDKGKAKDRATAHDGAAATLRMLRPAIARCKDESVKAFYNTALAALKRGSKVRGADANYGGFRRAARTPGKDRPSTYNRTQAADSKAADVNSTAQSVYDQLREGKVAK